MEQNELSTEEKNRSLIVSFPKMITADTVGKLDGMMKMWLLKEYQLFVFNFKNVLSIDQSLHRSANSFSKSLTQVSKHMASLSLNKDLKQDIVNSGMSDVFHPVETLAEAYKVAGIKVKRKVTVDVEFLNPFITGTVNTFETQFNIKLKNKPPYVKKSGEHVPDIGIVGVINLTCKDFTGYVTLGFPAAVFLKVYEEMLGEVHEKINEEVKDGAAEILNIIYGQAKSELNKRGYSLEKAIPTVLVGDNIEVQHSSKLPSFVVPFECNSGEFVLEISLSSD